MECRFDLWYKQSKSVKPIPELTGEHIRNIREAVSDSIVTYTFQLDKYKHEGINLINTTLKVKCPKLQMPIRFSDLKQQTLATSYDKYFKTSLVFLRKDAKGVNSMREAFKDYA
jgi:hypothetical protein